MDLTGLIIIGFGTGGIKPCVAAFGGDQFEVGQTDRLCCGITIWNMVRFDVLKIRVYYSENTKGIRGGGREAEPDTPMGRGSQPVKICLDYRLEAGNKAACQKKEFIDDVKSLLRVLVMFLPVPMFWALYDQQGSIWLIQGIQMDCRLFGNLLLLPDQMQTFERRFNSVVHSNLPNCHLSPGC
ncbi:hypothetical protein KIN20_009584 [Parelaphostrongylus tenuis]|uniref:Uncharacterized protein n=1 Tax=Parelaphostrongylus tenuis TaxID=148309 RepID=A0AAD5MXY7_PARTN|nr:hypothetical protein KIN20_009584 [Parelaphostrongylus tenuis]